MVGWCCSGVRGMGSWGWCGGVAGGWGAATSDRVRKQRPTATTPTLYCCHANALCQRRSRSAFTPITLHGRNAYAPLSRRKSHANGGNLPNVLPLPLSTFRKSARTLENRYSRSVNTSALSVISRLICTCRPQRSLACAAFRVPRSAFGGMKFASVTRLLAKASLACAAFRVPRSAMGGMKFANVTRLLAKASLASPGRR